MPLVCDFPLLLLVIHIKKDPLCRHQISDSNILQLIYILAHNSCEEAPPD